MKKTFILLALTLLCACSHSPEKVAPQTPVVMDHKAVASTMESHRKYIGNCYGKALLTKGNENLTGRMLVQFNIGPDGRSHNAQILAKESTIQDKNLNQCILEGLRSWDFPVHPEGKLVSINYPLHFHSKPPQDMQNKLDRFENLRSNRSVE